VLAPVTLDGTPASQSQLNDAATIVKRRFTKAGLPAPTITGGPAHTLQLRVAATMTADQIESLVARGVVTFRTVISTSTVPSTPTLPTDLGPQSDESTALGKAKAAVGPDAYALASSLVKPPSDNATIDRLAAFGTLSTAEVAALPVKIQFDVPTVSCAQLDARNPLFVTDNRFLDRQVVACDAGQPTVKYLLDGAKVGGVGDVASASADYDPAAYAADPWVLSLNFTAAGQRTFAALTAGETGRQIGILVDASVVSAPSIQSAVTNGPATAAGPAITDSTAHQLANLIDAGTLPILLTVENVSTS
jgi:preprotein translocase subunit SecD